MTDAIDAFIATKLEIDDLLARLRALSDEHFGVSPDAVSWGDVGSATWVRDKLAEALAHYRSVSTG